MSAACTAYSVNDLLLSPTFTAMLQTESHRTVVRSTRGALLRIRQEISEGQHTQDSLHSRVAELHIAVAGDIVRNRRYSLRRVINATGVILHTN
jgi:L-seryl-tRNA(Ser) seleniumtransferase